MKFSELKHKKGKKKTWNLILIHEIWLFFTKLCKRQNTDKRVNRTADQMLIKISFSQSANLFWFICGSFIFHFYENNQYFDDNPHSCHCRDVLCTQCNHCLMFLRIQTSSSVNFSSFFRLSNTMHLDNLCSLCCLCCLCWYGNFPTRFYLTGFNFFVLVELWMIRSGRILNNSICSNCE